MNRLFIFLTASLLTSLIQINPADAFEIRSSKIIESDSSITLLNPHTSTENKNFRFSSNRQTYEGLCSRILEQESIEQSSADFSSQGTAFLNSNGELISLRPISRSFKFVKCLK